MPRVKSTTMGVAAFATALVLVSAFPAAARPPEGATYFVLAIGLDGRYETRAECFTFTSTGLCSSDGQICGRWEMRESERRQAGLSFELFAVDGSDTVVMEGRAQLDDRGSRSSIGGAGRITGLGAVRNFSFSGRQASLANCLQLLQAFDEPGGNVVQGSGDVVTETREVAGFDGVTLTGVGRLILRQSGTESLTITAEDNILPLLRSQVIDGQLVLGPEPGTSLSTTRNIVYRLETARLRRLVVSGVTEVTATDVDTNQLDVDLSGVAEIKITGRARNQRLRVSGTSVYRARDLASRTVDVNISGLTTATVSVSRRLTGTVSGFGVLEYFGDPIVDVRVSGFGVVRKAGD